MSEPTPDRAGPQPSVGARPPAVASGLALALLLGCTSAPEATSKAARRTDDAPTAWSTPPPPSDFDRSRPVRAGFLIVDGVYNSELMAPYDVLHHTPFHTVPDPGIVVFTVSPDGNPVTTFEGLVVSAHHSFDDHPPIDVLVVPSAEHSMDSDLENARMIDWVRETGRRARFVVSLCDGAFVLAAAGLLDGRAVTTFPGDQDRFARTFPELDLRREADFVHDGPAITSEGGSKSYQPAMYLVAHLFGDEVAEGVGRGLLIDWPPAVSSTRSDSAPVRALLVNTPSGS